MIIYRRVVLRLWGSPNLQLLFNVARRVVPLLPTILSLILLQGSARLVRPRRVSLSGPLIYSIFNSHLLHLLTISPVTLYLFKLSHGYAHYISLCLIGKFDKLIHLGLTLVWAGFDKWLVTERALDAIIWRVWH